MKQLIWTGIVLDAGTDNVDSYDEPNVEISTVYKPGLKGQPGWETMILGPGHPLHLRHEWSATEVEAFEAHSKLFGLLTGREAVAAGREQ